MGDDKFSLCHMQCLSIFAKKSGVVLGELGISSPPPSFPFKSINTIRKIALLYFVTYIFVLRYYNSKELHITISRGQNVQSSGLAIVEMDSPLLLFHCLNRKWLVVWPNTKHINTIYSMWSFGLLNLETVESSYNSTILKTWRWKIFFKRLTSNHDYSSQ